MGVSYVEYVRFYIANNKDIVICRNFLSLSPESNDRFAGIC